MPRHQSDITEVEYPDRDDLLTTAPKDTGEVFDIVVRKGPISHDDMMQNQIYSMSSDAVYSALSALKDAGFVDRFEGDIHEHGTTRNLWYVPVGDS